MIKTIADLLNELMNNEKNRLGNYRLSHAPSIGKMYEGLSSEILNRAIPEGLDIKIKNGFIIDHKGNMSSQIDCMIVTGEGEVIPYSDSCKWKIENVIAIVEVKKNLYGKELTDSLEKFSSIFDSYRQWLNDEGLKSYKKSISSTYRAFETITGNIAPDNMSQMSTEQKIIFYTILSEQILPVRIVLGYDGFSSEETLRKSVTSFMEQKVKTHGFGAPCLPHLITCNGKSILKMNGFPYMAPAHNGKWPLMCSTSTNPLWMMLELIWTKIDSIFETTMPYGSDLDAEAVSPFIFAKPIASEGKFGWLYEYTEAIINENTSMIEWEPMEVPLWQYVAFGKLCQLNEMRLDCDFISGLLADTGLSLDAFTAGMRKTGFIAFDDEKIKLTTLNLKCAITSGGKFIVGEDTDGKMINYIARESAKA